VAEPQGPSPEARAKLMQLREEFAKRAEMERRRQLGQQHLEDAMKKTQPLRPLGQADTEAPVQLGSTDMDSMRYALMNKGGNVRSFEDGGSNSIDLNDLQQAIKGRAPTIPEQFNRYIAPHINRGLDAMLPFRQLVQKKFENNVYNPLNEAVLNNISSAIKTSGVNDSDVEMGKTHIANAVKKSIGMEPQRILFDAQKALGDINEGEFDRQYVDMDKRYAQRYEELKKLIAKGKAEGGTVNPFDYENPEHVASVSEHVAKHKDFSKLPDASKRLGETLSQGSYKHIEDPRVQMALRKLGHNAYFTQEKTGKKLNQMVIKKAIGGAVPSINQMRQALLANGKSAFGNIENVGANEAPNMDVKAYINPDQKRDGIMPIGGVTMGNQPLPMGGVDMSKQGGQQLMPPNMTPPPQQGQPQGAPQGGMPPMPPTGGAPNPMAQPPSNILQMTPQGQAMSAMQPPKPQGMANGGIATLGQMTGAVNSPSVPQFSQGGLEPNPLPTIIKAPDSNDRPPVSNQNMDNGATDYTIDNFQQLAKGGKVEVRPTVFDDKATRRNERIEEAARALMEGDMKQKAYAKVVAKEKPVKPYDFIPMPATDEQAMNVLIPKQKESYRTHESWPEGHRVGLRLDIPSYERHGVWINSIHDESSGKDKFPPSYGPVSSVRNAEFQGTPNKAIRVATGEQNKAPFAKIMGELEHIDEEKALKHMMKYLRHPDYRQVGYDPRRHGDFYDRETMEPITHSEHVVQIGPLVLAKKPVYGKRTLYKEGGTAKPTTKSPDKFKPTATKASEALGKHEGKHLKVTQSDRTKVGGGFLGGPGFSGLQHIYPSHKDVAWGVNSTGAASKIANANAMHPEGQALWSTLLGAPNQHTSNQMVFDMLMKQFKNSIKSGKMTPELRNNINEQLGIAVDKEGKPVFGNPDISSKNFFKNLNTFDQRRVMADLMGGKAVGGKKGQIINYDKTVSDTTEPELLGAPTHAIGPRLFQLSGQRSVQPDLNPAFPHMLHGEDLGQMYHPVPREIMLPEFHKKIKETKGRNVGVMDLTRNTPSQHLTEDFLTHLQKHGYKKGGNVSMDEMQATLTLKKKKAK